MALAIRVFLCFLSLGAFTATVYAQQPVESPNENIDWPSPDGTFAFITSYGEDLHSIDLIDKKSGRKLQRIAELDSSMASWHVLWGPHSNRFALMTRVGHPIQGVDIYLENGDTFRKIQLHLPEADIPERLRHGRNFSHFANLNWQEATEWRRDGSLLVTITTMVDGEVGGEGGSITATRTVVLGFDRVGKPKIVKSTIRYETDKD
jgi:hypothetical protein